MPVGRTTGNVEVRGVRRAFDFRRPATTWTWARRWAWTSRPAQQALGLRLRLDARRSPGCTARSPSSCWTHSQEHGYTGVLRLISCRPRRCAAPASRRSSEADLFHVTSGDQGVRQ